VLTDSEVTQSETTGRSAAAPSRSGLLEALDTLRALTEGLLSQGRRGDLFDARTRLAADRFNLAVLGEFKRGKSTLVNALLGRDLLPTGVVPLTSVITAIAAGPRDRLVVHYVDGRALEQPIAALPQFVTEARNPHNGLGVSFARVEVQHDLLRAGLELVDTPGIGSIHSHNTEVARDFLPRVDAALCVLDAGQPLSAAEREMLRDCAERIPRLLIVLNKVDQVSDTDRAAALEFVRTALNDALGADGAEIYAVSARHGDGLEALRARLLGLAAGERELLLLCSVAGVAHDVALSAAQAASFEARAVRLPLQELASRVVDFDRRGAELRAAGTEAGDLLERGGERALQALVNQPLGTYARDHEAALRAALRQRAETLGRCSARDLASQLEAWIDESVRGTFADLVPRFESAIADQLTELEARYAQRVTEIIEAVQAAAEDVFGTRAGRSVSQFGLRTPSRFSFKLHDVENALDMIVGLGRTVTPGTLGRRLVVRHAEQRLLDMTDRHAGRLRSELAEGVSAAVREYRRELATLVDEAFDSIHAAVERASQDRRRGQPRADARLQELSQIQRGCREIAAEMEGLLPGRTARDETEMP
jgi:small GTP-binding protein